MKKLPLLSLLLALTHPCQAGSLQVQDVHGQAYFSQGEQQPSTPLQENTYLAPGSFIRTEGTGSTFISPVPSNTLYFGSMTDAQISRLIQPKSKNGYSVNQVDAELYSGKITSFINSHGKQGTEFSLRTPGALITANSAIFVTCVSDVGVSIYVVKGSVTISPLDGSGKPQVLLQNHGTEIRSSTGLVRPVAFSPGMSEDSMQCLRSGMTRDILSEGEALVGTSNLQSPLQNFSNYFKTGPDEFNLDDLGTNAGPVIGPIVSPTQ